MSLPASKTRLIEKTLTRLDKKNASAEPSQLPPCRVTPQARLFDRYIDNQMRNTNDCDTERRGEAATPGNWKRQEKAHRPTRDPPGSEGRDPGSHRAELFQGKTLVGENDRESAALVA
jgi:hypothetical protein